MSHATAEEVQLITDRLKHLGNEIGLEFHPFLVEWYNSQLKESFHLSYHADTLVYCIVSSPSMFEKAFLPYMKEVQNDQLCDPLDQCMKYHLSRIQQDDLIASYSSEVLHDYEVHTNRRPKILVQTAGHVSGAAFFYQKKDVKNSPWNKDQRICGVSVHPTYSGWFAFRGALVFPTIRAPFLSQEPPVDLLGDDDASKIDLLTKFNFSWKDWTFRDIPFTNDSYSDLQRSYLMTVPADRFDLIKDLISKD